MIPFEALLPMGVMVTFAALYGGVAANLNNFRVGGRERRIGYDSWDLAMHERDRRLTGFRRGSSDDPVAPEEFKLNSRKLAFKTNSIVGLSPGNRAI